MVPWTSDTTSHPGIGGIREVNHVVWSRRRSEIPNLGRMTGKAMLVRRTYRLT
jgi:hypothetical protein